jgi:hypothetical protein
MIAIGARSLALHKSAWLLLLVPGGAGFPVAGLETSSCIAP